jgi:hypothetical protein
VQELERGNLFNIFGGVATERLRTSHAALAVSIFAAALLAISFNLVPMPVAALGGAFLMMLTGCIAPEDAYRRVEWKVLILIGALLSLGVAMEATGTGRYLADQLIALVRRGKPAPAADMLLRPHRCPDAAHVEPGRGHRGGPHRLRDGAAIGPQPPKLRDDDRDRGELLLPDAARTVEPHGLRAGEIPIHGFREGGISPHLSDLCPGAPAGAGVLAGQVMPSRDSTTITTTTRPTR